MSENFTNITRWRRMTGITDQTEQLLVAGHALGRVTIDHKKTEVEWKVLMGNITLASSTIPVERKAKYHLDSCVIVAFDAARKAVESEVYSLVSKIMECESQKVVSHYRRYSDGDIRD